MKFVLVNIYLGSKNVDIQFKREAVVSLSWFLALPDLRSRAESPRKKQPPIAELVRRSSDAFYSHEQSCLKL